MGSQQSVSEHLRERLRNERERRGWSQKHLTEKLKARGIALSSSTIAKIEAGDRNVTVDETAALADIFGLSIDTLVGHNPSTSDLVWAVSKLTSQAQKMVVEIDAVSHRISGELQDVRHYAQYDPMPIDEIVDSAVTACELLKATRLALIRVAEGLLPIGVRQ